MDFAKVIAPAKVNLMLGIGARRPDGYHDVSTVMHTLALHDVVTLRRTSLAELPDEGLTVRVTCETYGGIEPLAIAEADNLGYKAAYAFAELIGRTESELIEITIDKNIPHQAGLGGGSSDAAAVLVGLATIWGIDRDDPRLVEAAASLGADVRFFLVGGCAYLTGKGDVFEQQLLPRRDTIVLVRPDDTTGVSTSDAYAMFDEAPVSLDPDVLDRASKAACANDVPVYNNLAYASERIVPALAEVREWLVAQEGVIDVALCGSGAMTFAVCRSFDDAQTVVLEARRRGWNARSTSFSSIRHELMPPRRF